MSAVFGSVYSLNTTISACTSQYSQNGEYEPTPESQSEVPINHRKLKIALSNNSEVYTDKIISHKGCVNSSFFGNMDCMRWVSRAIFVTNMSAIKGNREHSDILMFPFHINCIEKPAVLLEFPTDNIRNTHKEELYIVHLTSFTGTLCCDSRELFQDYTSKIFTKYCTEIATELEKPQILFECFFTLPEFSDVSIDLKREDDIVNHLVFVNSSSNEMEFDECLKEAQDCFTNLLPGIQFLPRPPDPEDIIQLGHEAIPSSNAVSGDFPFATTLQLNADLLDAPGDGSGGPAVVADGLEGPALSGLLAEMELNASSSDTDNFRQ